jgi:uncharacterized BrkB/YihY/UPF0761 family membrane protein
VESPKRPGAAGEPLSRFERTRTRSAALQARAKRIAERAEAERSRHSSLDAVYEIVDRDIEVGGSILAGALAYRFFVWLLPFALVLVAGLGIASDVASRSPESAAKSLGVTGLVSHSVASAANGPARWYALIVGIPTMLYMTRTLLRALIVEHRLVWTDLRATAPRPTPSATFRFLGLLLCLFLASGLAATARAWSVGVGVLASLVVIVPYAGLWLLVSSRLPHRDAPWTALWPGALLLGVGIEVIQLVGAYVFGPLSLSREGTYGALGIAAALLLALFFISRLVVAAAGLNATLWERRVRGSSVGHPAAVDEQVRP